MSVGSATELTSRPLILQLGKQAQRRGWVSPVTAVSGEAGPLPRREASQGDWAHPAAQRCPWCPASTAPGSNPSPPLLADGHSTLTGQKQLGWHLGGAEGRQGSRRELEFRGARGQSRRGPTWHGVSDRKGKARSRGPSQASSAPRRARHAWLTQLR